MWRLRRADLATATTSRLAPDRPEADDEDAGDNRDGYAKQKDDDQREEAQPEVAVKGVNHD